jgi:hypothetical protein
MVQLLIRTLFYISLFILILCLEVKGQEDSIINQNSTLKNSTIGKENQAKQNYLDENLREERTLLKLYINPYFIYQKGMESNGGFSSSIAYERKIVPSLSFLISNNFHFGFVSSHPYFSSNGDFGLRYYYSARKKIKESIGANNFHNNYFAVGINKFYTYFQGFTIYNSYNNGVLIYSDYSKYREWLFEPNITISWGIQRRIKKWGFYDIEPYFMLPIDGGYYYGVNLKLGLAWGF